tara:strand:- start:2024 stop:2413 length:390 start_codon:yes stop_codon:yes gene_type:complete
MNILGNGVDIIENKRISNSLKNRLFLYRIFTDTEITISKKIKNKDSFFAKRFAAKEAFVKALGTGFRDNINYRDISIINNKKGKPLINLSKNLKNYLKNKLKIKKYKVHLSLSDEKKHSIAFVIINKIK